MPIRKWPPDPPPGKPAAPKENKENLKPAGTAAAASKSPKLEPKSTAAAAAKDATKKVTAAAGGAGGSSALTKKEKAPPSKLAAGTTPSAKTAATKKATTSAAKDKTTAAAAAPAEAEEPVKKERKKIVIPFVLPWESRPAVQNQAGMGAFGSGRNVKTKVDPGTKEYEIKNAETALKSENIIPLLTDNANLATQKGMNMGGFRDQVINRSINYGSREFDKTKLMACEGVIPKQSGTNESHGQAGQTPIGALRSQVPKVHFKDNMSPSMDPTSKSFLAKFSSPNPNCHAGTTVIDKIRRQVPEVVVGSQRRRGVPHSKRTEAILPKFQVRTGLDTCQGTGAGCHGLGPFRQVITPVTGGYNFTEDEIMASKSSKSWATSSALTSQQGTGGFQKRRDVVGIAKHQIMKGT